MQNKPLQLCSTHLTVFAFTGCTWCNNCQKLKTTINMLQEGSANNYHLFNFDDANSLGFAFGNKFGVVGVPVFIIFDPNGQRFFKYEGSMNAADMQTCISSKTCVGRNFPLNQELKFAAVEHTEAVSFVDEITTEMRKIDEDREHKKEEEEKKKTKAATSEQKTQTPAKEQLLPTGTMNKPPPGMSGPPPGMSGPPPGMSVPLPGLSGPPPGLPGPPPGISAPPGMQKNPKPTYSLMSLPQQDDLSDMPTLESLVLNPTRREINVPKQKEINVNKEVTRTKVKSEFEGKSDGFTITKADFPVCSTCFTWYIFTMKGCPACEVAKPYIEELKKQNTAAISEIDADHDDAMTFGINMFPTFLRYDPARQELRAFSRSEILDSQRYPGTLVQQPSVNFVPTQCQRAPMQQQQRQQDGTYFHAQCPCMNQDNDRVILETVTIRDLPLDNNNSSKIMQGACTEMQPHEQPLDQPIFNPNARPCSEIEHPATFHMQPHQQQQQQMSQAFSNDVANLTALAELMMLKDQTQHSQTHLGSEKETKQVSSKKHLVFELCPTCPTFFVFTGRQWCQVCKLFAPVVKELIEKSKCGSHHVQNFDLKLNVENRDREACNVFNIREYPTVLVFDPKTYQFGVYNRSLIARDMIRAVHNIRTSISKTVPTPPEVSFRFTTPKKDPFSTQHAQHKINFKACAHCITILIFAMDQKHFEKLLSENGKNVHVFFFTPADPKHKDVIEAFNITSFPTILVYDPKMGLFYPPLNHHQTDIAAFTGPDANYITESWNDHPNVIHQF